MSTLLRVLIIEDSEDDAELLVRELHRGGYDVTFERVDTPAGLLGAFDHEWDLVLCDYSMPYFSGADALRAFRSRGWDVPFIFVSGNAEETIAAALGRGPQGYVTKGNLDHLVLIIHRELKKKDQQRSAEKLEPRRQSTRSIREQNCG